jgi:Rieske 2Fe-2S family protein
MGSLRRGYRVSYDLKANWKLIVQNYSECLHCPVIHPALQKLSDYTSGENDPSTDAWTGGSMRLRDEAFTMSRDGRPRRPPLPGLDGHQRRRVYYYAILPNLLLSLHPDYVMTHTLWPRACDRTDVVCEWHFHPAELANPAFDPGDVIDFWDETNRQDWRVSERSQLGIGSRAYTPGPYSPREGLLWDFDQAVRRAIGDH